MGKRKKAVDEIETELVESPKEKTAGKWIAKINVICGANVQLKKGDEIPAELVEELKAEGFAELA